MTAGKCLRLQDEATETFGADKAGKCSTCPCDQGIEIRRGIKMAKKKGKKICVNCGRLMAIAQEGLCGGCWCRTKGLDGDARDEALKKAAADFGGVPEGRRAKQRKYYRGPRVKPEAPDSVNPVPLDEKATDAEIDEYFLRKVEEVAAKHPGLTFEPAPAGSESVLSIVVNFLHDDGPLFEGLMKLGRKYRRSPDQQILWILEKELLNERLLSPVKTDQTAGRVERLPEFPEAFTGTDPQKGEQYVS